MNAVILAAGTGSRLVNLTRELPKALVQIHGKALIDYAVSFVNELGCEQVVVVGGFYFQKLEDHLDQKSLSVQLLENPNFLKGSVLTLLEALPRITDSFLLMNVDHIYPRRLARLFSENRHTLVNVTAFVDFDRPLRDDDMKVLLTEDNRVSRISKTLQQFDGGYIGLTYVPKNMLDTYSRAAIKLAKENPEASVEGVLQTLVSSGEKPLILDTSGLGWLEIDNPSDLLNAERILRRVTNYLE